MLYKGINTDIKCSLHAYTGQYHKHTFTSLKGATHNKCAAITITINVQWKYLLVTGKVVKINTVFLNDSDGVAFF